LCGDVMNCHTQTLMPEVPHSCDHHRKIILNTVFNGILVAN
jgi:hypothetical protein